MIRPLPRPALLAAIWLLASLPLTTLGQRAAPTLAVKVVGITDGDTITVVDDAKHQIKVRLEGIDAPESGQAFGTQAKKALSDKVFGKPVTIKETGKDKYGRTLASVYVGKQHVNRELVAEGFAWHYKEYNSDANLAAAEKEARAAKRGLWRDDSPMPPWDFRHAPKTQPNAESKPSRTAAKSEPATPTVYVTFTGDKYHRDGCKYLAKSKLAMSLEEAKERHTPCSVCKPPQ
jgi:micrococcal nuclease